MTRELAAARTELDELRAAHAKLREEHGRAGEDNEVLRLSRTQLAADIDALQSEVAHRREAEEHWRQAYVEACKRRSVETGTAPEIANVRDAVTLAEQAFSGCTALRPQRQVRSRDPVRETRGSVRRAGLARDLLPPPGRNHRRDLPRLVLQARPDRRGRPASTGSGTRRPWTGAPSKSSTTSVRGASFDPQKHDPHRASPGTTNTVVWSWGSSVATNARSDDVPTAIPS